MILYNIVVQGYQPKMYSTSEYVFKCQYGSNQNCTYVIESSLIMSVFCAIMTILSVVLPRPSMKSFCRISAFFDFVAAILFFSFGVLLAISDFHDSAQKAATAFSFLLFFAFVRKPLSSFIRVKKTFI